MYTCGDCICAHMGDCICTHVGAEYVHMCVQVHMLKSGSEDDVQPPLLSPSDLLL